MSQTATSLLAYEAVADDGTLVQGKLEAANPTELERALAQRHLALVRCRRAFTPFSHRDRRIPSADLAELANYVAITCKAGLSLIDSLEEFAQLSTSKPLKRALGAVVQDVRSGMTLSQAFARHPRGFPEDLRALTAAGEASGQMEEIMRRLAAQIQFELDVRGKVKTALYYPCILGVAVIGLIILLLTFLLPRIVGMLAQNGVALPTPTRVLLAISRFLRADWWVLLLGVAGAWIGLVRLRRTRSGAVLSNRFALRLPAVGRLLHLTAQTRFVSTLRTLYGAGVDAVSAFDLAADACGAPAWVVPLHAVADEVRDGKSLHESLKAVRIFHPLVMRMVELGERSGAMEETLGSCIDYFAGEIPKLARRAIALLEPAILVVAGGAVAFILLAALLPVFAMYSSV